MEKGMKACFMLIVAAVILFSASVAAAEPDYDFYKGKVINYIVATKPGGGYDAYARTIVQFMQKYIPGVTINVKNVPGAGHVIGANEIYLAKPDGLTIGTFNTGLIYSQIVGLQGIKFDLAKYSWIGKASSEPRVFIVGPNTSYKTIKDVMESKEPVKLAGAGAGTEANNNTVLIFEAATGINFKIVTGYAGREAEMAMMRGTVAGQIGSYAGFADFIKSKQCRVILQIAAKKHKDLKEVPLASELKISEKGKKLLAVIGTTSEIGRFTAGTPNIPPGRLQALREAYKKALTDPEFLKEAARKNMELDPDYGEDVAQLIKAALHQPPENVETFKKIIKAE